MRYFLGLLALALASCGSRPSSSNLNDIDSSLTVTGRDGARYLYYLDVHDGDSRSSGQKRNTALAVFRGQCSSKAENNRDSCKHNRQSIGLDTFFEVVLGDSSTEAIKAFASQLGAEHELGAAIVAEYMAQEPNIKQEDKEALLELAKQNAKAAGKKAKVVDRIGRNLSSFFIFLNELAATEKPVRYNEESLASMGSGEAKRDYLLNLNNYFSAGKHSEGRSCATKDKSGRFVSEGGGCKDKQTGIIWGPVARSFEGFSDDTWFDRDSALSFCASSTVGGRYDWELASEDELIELAKGPYRIVGLSGDLHYWSATQGEEKIFEDVEGALPDREILKNDTDLLLGYSSYSSRSSSSSNSTTNSSNSSSYSNNQTQMVPFKSQKDPSTQRSMSTYRPSEDTIVEFRPVTSTYTHGSFSSTTDSKSSNSGSSGSSSHAVTGRAFTVFKAIERSVKGKVQVKSETQTVVQMGTAKSFQLKRFSLIGAEGELKETRTRWEDKPLSATETSFSSSYDNSSSQYRSTDLPDYETNKFSDAIHGYTSFEATIRSYNNSSNRNSSSSSSSSSSVTREVGRSRSVDILSRDVEKVNPLNYISYQLPKEIKHNTVSVICRAKGAVAK